MAGNANKAVEAPFEKNVAPVGVESNLAPVGPEKVVHVSTKALHVSEGGDFVDSKEKGGQNGMGCAAVAESSRTQDSLEASLPADTGETSVADSAEPAVKGVEEEALQTGMDNTPVTHETPVSDIVDGDNKMDEAGDTPEENNCAPEGEDADGDYDPFAEAPVEHVANDDQSAEPASANTVLGEVVIQTADSIVKGFKAKAAALSAPPKADKEEAQCVSVNIDDCQEQSRVVDSPSMVNPATSQSKAASWAGSPTASSVGEALSASTPKAAASKIMMCFDSPPGPPPGPVPADFSVPPGPPPDPEVRMKMPPAATPKGMLAFGSPVSSINSNHSPFFGLPPLATSGLPLPLPLPPKLPAVDFAIPFPAGPPPLSLQSVWETHMSPTMVPYYYCKATGESRWVRPCGPFDLVLDVGSVAPALQQQGLGMVPCEGAIKSKIGEPESWESIGKTGWLRVETDKGFKYFFHKKKKKTSWDCPPEIAKDVAELDGVLGIAENSAQGDATEQAGVEQDGDGDHTSGDPSTDINPHSDRLSKSERGKLHEKKVEEESKAAREKQNLLNFKQMLLEKGVKSFDKYATWMPKLLHDPRFTAVKGDAERRTLFAALAKRIDADRQKQKLEKKRCGRDGLREVLEVGEKSGLFAASRSEDVVRQFERKFGDDCRWFSVPERDREKRITERFGEITKQREKTSDEARCYFRELVFCKLRGPGQKQIPEYPTLKRELSKNADYKRIVGLISSTDLERLYGDVVREIRNNQQKESRQKKKDLDDVENVRKKRRTSLAEDSLTNLFAERVKSPFAVSWQEVKEALGEHMKDIRLTEQEQESLFMQYRRAKIDFRCQEFMHLLQNVPVDVVGPHLSFEEVCGHVCTGIYACQFAGMPEEDLRGAWAEWRSRALTRALDTCKQWLRSSGLLTGYEGARPGTPPFDALIDELRKADIRFRRLDVVEEKRARVVMERLEELKESKTHGRKARTNEST